MPEQTFRRRLLDEARLGAGMRALDIGCGTGTLLVQAAEMQPAAAPWGVDGDLSILKLASDKIAESRAEVRVVAGLAGRLPFRSGAFDRAFSTLMLHHLTHAEKTAALSEAFRVLRLGGDLHIADWGRPHTRAMRLASVMFRSFERSDRTADTLSGRIRELCEGAGFTDVRTKCLFQTMFGTLELIVASKT